ncbi:MAG: sigma-70 family RNA polymerase sigma factor [Acidobacteria bacterium]|nr:MAG: sigma-70 family RNA polymerase sigma factor [Acidobacteriota bacterium]
MDRDGDTALLRRAREGSQEALEELFARCGGRLLSLVRLRMGPALRRRLESRDVLQATLLKAFAHLDRVNAEDGASLMAWLARIAGNEIRDQAAYHNRQRRAAAREVPLEDGDAVATRVRSAVSRLILDQRTRWLEQALESLPPAQREVIVLRRFEELPWAAVGERLGIGADAARMRYARAMAALTLAAGEAPPEAR